MEPSIVGLIEVHPQLVHEGWKIVPPPDLDGLEERSAEVDSGDWSQELIELIVVGTATDPSLRARAGVAKKAWRNRMPIDRSIEDDGTGRAIADWSGPWCDPQLDVEVWLPESWGSMADALERIDGAGPVIRQPWPPAAWLLEPEKVAAEVPTDH